MFKVSPFGDEALHIQLGDEVSPEVLERVQAFFRLIGDKKDARIQELIPSYHSVTIFLRPSVRFEEMFTWVNSVYVEYERAVANHKLSESRLVKIPVCYGGEFGPDLQELADYHGLAVEEVIRLHSQPAYLVYMIGFMPGFAYMGGLEPCLATPRLASPRTLVPKGSVGIAGQQTGLYPLDSPGGWRLIGRTPLSLFDALSDPPTLLQSGDHVRFVAIDKEEYVQLKGNSQ
ncbi:MAG: 5-oxoprolinase subunit PxpB [Desulfitobacteriaceae bacterium]